MMLNSKQPSRRSNEMTSKYVETKEEMRTLLLERYGKIPEGDIEAYIWIRQQTGIEDKNLTYEQKTSRHKTLCQILGFSSEGGLAGRDINNY